MDSLEDPELEVCCLKPLDGALPLDAWQGLSEISLDPNPFFSPSFLRPLLKEMNGEGVRLIAVRNKTTGEWRMAAPVGRRRLGLALPVQTAWATDYSPLGTPLLHPEAGPETPELFLKAAAGPGKVLAVPYLPLTSETAQRMLEAGGGRIVVTARSERACHTGGRQGEEQFKTAFSGKRRKEMNRLLRRLGEHGETRFESLQGASACEGFEAFLDLEAAGWKGRGGTALKSRPETAAFARQAIANCAERNALRIDRLWAGDKLVAALVLFIERGSVFAWKIAFDEDFARYSPGAQLVLETFRKNLEMPGFSLADSLAIPGHSMIEPLWRGRLETGMLLVAFGAAAKLRQDLCLADMAAERFLRSAARSLRDRLKTG